MGSRVLPAKVLVADADDEHRTALEKSLIEAGYEVAVAPSGSFVVTMLEWERPDVVVSCAEIGDMNGYELFTEVRKDPTTIDTPFLLVAGRNRPIALAAAEAGVDRIVTGEFTIETIVQGIGELLNRTLDESDEPGKAYDDAPSADRSPQPLWQVIDAPGAVPLTPSAPAFQGSLGAMDLPEVTQALALGGKTGCLKVSLAAGEGAILFENGRIVHAGFRGLTGEEAFAALISAAQGQPQAGFCFNRADRVEVARIPRTISRSVDQLLLSIAAGIDEAGADLGRTPEAVMSQRGREDA
jgi:CheY-like chemotaxis protein